jgi:hypothetical protein
MNRAQRRKLGIKGKKPDLEKKIGLFNKLPKQCTNCDKSYDKTNKEMVKTWTVVVRENENKVNLYCPTCWDNAKKMISELKEKLNENKS